MPKTTNEENEIIATMQKDTAAMKALLAKMSKNADQLAAINHVGGRFVQAADAMIWAGKVRAIHGALLAAHGEASKALISGFGNGAEIVAFGPGR